MLSHENYLSEETSRMVRGVGGWTNESNAAVSHVARFSPYTETIGSDVQGNSLKATAIAAGDMTVITERFLVDPGISYKQFAWVIGAALDTNIGIRYYDVSGFLLVDDNYTFDGISTTRWNGVFWQAIAPENAVFGELVVTFESAAIGDAMNISRPSVMQQSKITTEFVDYALYHVPDYMIEADLAQSPVSYGAPAPFTRYTTVGSKQLSDAHETIISWDTVAPIDSETGTVDTSSLVDPFKAETEWLPWVAQLMGVSLDTIPAGGRSPWLAFEGVGIDTWTEWEEDVDPGSIPGIPDTEWVDIESFSPDYFDTDLARRLQIATGFNGVLGGTSESILQYVAALLNTDAEDPFVYVFKHYGTNPYRVLVATLATEDPDPNGNMLELAVEAATPAGTDVITGHGVSITARSFYSLPLMYQNMWTDISQGGGLLPVRFVENGAANGKHLSLGSISVSNKPFMGGGIGLARWYPGFALYSGAVLAQTESINALNIVGDIDIRVQLSDVTAPSSGTRRIISSNDKWALYLRSDDKLQFEWEFSGTRTAVSTEAIDWGNTDRSPFWIRIAFDVNNDASGHDIMFYLADTLYEEDWTQLGETITNAGTSGIDSTATNYLSIMGKQTTPNTDAVSSIVYRTMVLAGIDGQIAFDMNLTGEIDFATSNINTGTQFFRLPIGNIGVDVSTAVSGATNLDESLWTAQVHGGGLDYFYFGHSPYSYDSGDPQNLDDEIVVSSLPSDTYDWTINLIGGGTITGSTGTVTTITWKADDYGGNSITSIVVREDTGQSIQAQFDPDMFEGSADNATDSYGSDWDLNRDTQKLYFSEHSAFVDRDYISPTRYAGVFTSGITFDADETFTTSVAVRRFWSGAVGTTNIVDHITTSGWQLRYNGDDIEALVTDGTTTVTLTYDEVVGGTLGDFTLVTLLRDVGSETISLWINDTMVDSDPDPFVGGGLFATTGNTGLVGDDAATFKFDLHYLGMFDRNLSASDIGLLANEMARLLYVLPQAPQNVFVPVINAAPYVYFPAAAAPIRPALLDASPTFYNVTVVAL